MENWDIGIMGEKQTVREAPSFHYSSICSAEHFVVPIALFLEKPFLAPPWRLREGAVGLNQSHLLGGWILY
jgi:hypothetical protein